MKTSCLKALPLAWAAAALLWAAQPALAAPGDPALPSPPATNQGLAAAFLAGRHAEAAADSSLAATYYSRALAYDPDNANLLRESYFTNAQIGDIDAAIPAAKKSVQLMPNRTLPALIVAVGYFRQQDYPAAWSYIERISADGVSGIALPMLRAWGMSPLRGAEEALAELAPLQTTDGMGEIFHVMSGLLNEKYGRGAEAMVHYDALAKTIEQQPMSILRVVAGGYHRLGRSNDVQDLLDRYRGARGATAIADEYIVSFGEARRMPREVTPAEGMSEALFAASQLLLQGSANQFYARASIVFAQLALHLNPELSIARRIIGMNLAARQRYEESNTILATIDEREPGYMTVQLQIAGNLERMQQREEALAILQDVAEEKPEWVEAHIAIADFHRRAQQYTEAVAAYDRAFAAMPKNETASWALYYARGIALERAKNWQRAEDNFKQALQLNPDEPSVLNYLGYSWLDRGVNMREARALIERAYQKRPEDGAIIDSMGWAMYKMGEYDNAVIHLEKAVEAQPSDPTINEHLGDAYWKVGRRNEARFQWQRALILDPDDTQRTAIRAKLEQGLAQN